MNLVFGGAYQGKLDFAKNEFGLSNGDVLNMADLCQMARTKNDQDLNYGVDAVINQNIRTAKCAYGLDEYIRLMIDRGLDSDAWIEELIEGVKELETVIIMNDYSQGLVPMDAEDRKFREANGRAMIKLAESAENVYRVFCGIGTNIK